MEEQQLLEARVRAKSITSHNRPSILVDNPTYDDFDETTIVEGRDNLYGQDGSSFDDSYSGSDLDEASFASETSDGILSPEEIDKQEKQIIALKEHQRVFRARIFVVILLLITAVSNAVIVYFLTYNQEVESYEFHVSVDDVCFR